MGVLPLTDGSTAVTVVISHCLVDGIAGMILIFEAITDNIRDLGYPPPHSRTRRRAAVSDSRETLQGLRPGCPGARRGGKTGVSWPARYCPTGRHREPLRPLKTADGKVIVPTVTIYVDLDDLDARANALGGTSYSLFAGVAAKLGEHLGRRRVDDGTVTLLIPFSDRTLDDTRAMAMSFAKVSVDPTQVTTDLSERPGHHKAGAENGAGDSRSGAADPSVDPVYTEAGGATNWRSDVRLRAIPPCCVPISATFPPR